MMSGLSLVVRRDRRYGRKIMFPVVGQVDSYMRALIAAASEVYKIRPDIILEGPRWNRECFTARASVMYLARLRGFSTNQIGRFFSRDHTTIMYSCERVKDHVSRDVELRESLRAIAQLMSERRAA